LEKGAAPEKSLGTATVTVATGELRVAASLLTGTFMIEKQICKT
jgi:hypothetical protein